MVLRGELGHNRLILLGWWPWSFWVACLPVGESDNAPRHSQAACLSGGLVLQYEGPGWACYPCPAVTTCAHRHRPVGSLSHRARWYTLQKQHMCMNQANMHGISNRTKAIGMHTKEMQTRTRTIRMPKNADYMRQRASERGVLLVHLEVQQAGECALRCDFATPNPFRTCPSFRPSPNVRKRLADNTRSVNSLNLLRSLPGGISALPQKGGACERSEQVRLRTHSSGELRPLHCQKSQFLRTKQPNGQTDQARLSTRDKTRKHMTNA